MVPPPAGTIGTGNKSSTTSFSELSNLLNVVVFPNPTTDFVQVQISENIKYVLLYDTDGKLLRQSTMPSISLEGLKAGWYLLKVETNTASIYQKIIKQ